MEQTIKTFADVMQIVSNGTHEVFWKNTAYKIVKDGNSLLVQYNNGQNYVGLTDDYKIEDLFVLPKTV